MTIESVEIANRTWQLSSEATALWDRFPPRRTPRSWPATRQDREKVVAHLSKPPFLAKEKGVRSHRKLALATVLDWLQLYPGDSWQERWQATRAGVDGNRDWRLKLIDELNAVGGLAGRREYVKMTLGQGLMQMIGGDYLRPSLSWLLTTSSPLRIANEMARVRDPHGLAQLRTVRMTSTVGDATMLPAIEKVAIIMATKGGTIRDITAGDCLELLKTSREVFPGATHHSPLLYQLLFSAGIFPAGVPATVRMFNPCFAGQLPVERLIDRYDLVCRPVRDLLVDYLRERQPAVDYNTLTSLATALALWFWKDLERHHPGIDSLRLSPDIAAAWKQRIRTRTVRSKNQNGEIVETTIERDGAADALITVRGFYLDLAQWAYDEPARWGPWAAPCPIRAEDVQHRKMTRRRKARMDQRTRERLPVLPLLVEAVDRERKAAATRLESATNAALGEQFTVDGVALRRARINRRSPPGLGRRTDDWPPTRPHPRGGERVLGVGRGGGASHDRSQSRRTHRAHPPQPDSIPPTSHQ